jgi:hypothetical protein
MRISCQISLEDIVMPYLLYLSTVLIQTYPVFVELLRLALRSASLQSTIPDSAQDSTCL